MLSRTGSRVSGTRVGLACVLACAGCGLFGGGPGGGSADPTAQTTQDIAAYEQLTTTLEQNRLEFAGKQYSYQEAFGSKLYYLDFPGFDPRLHRFDTVSGARLNYTFAIGTGDAFNYRVSDSLIVTARNAGSMVEYKAYAADAAAQLVGQTSLIAPSGAKWWAYAVAAGDVYIVTYDAAGPATTLRKWTPGGAVQDLFTLESATGQSRLGELLDFGVDGDTLVFIEGGRIWRGSLAQKRASFLQNKTQVTGGTVSFEPDGVTFAAGASLYFFQSATGTLIDVAAKLRDSPFRLSSTFKTSHYYYGDASGFSRYGGYLLYIGSSGVFAYDLAKDAVRPVLLEPRDAELRTVYRYPVVTTNGFLFVTGLQSASGSVGADGPIFRVDLNKTFAASSPLAAATAD